MVYDFNVLETTATALKEAGKHHDALRIYLFMADGDQSLDGGYLGERIGVPETIGAMLAVAGAVALSYEERPPTSR